MTATVVRRIVMFLDGTWNADDGSNPPTNIVRLHEALKLGVSRCPAFTVPTPSASLAQGSVVQGLKGPTEYIVYYDGGVGTGPFDRLTGGIVGQGLDDNIRQAYRFLSKHYQPGAEIHIFGFSRGAFTARSVVGYLFATGLLTAANCTAEREAQAWKLYRTPPQDRHCGDWYALKDFVHSADALTVKTLGVFDTVGALGIPAAPLQKINAKRFAFHNTELSSIVENSFHAVAIDEHRVAFEAALWQSPKFKTYSGANVEQVWFPGAHADIGGGYAPWDAVGAAPGRQDIAFEWMIRRLIDCVGLDFAAPPSPAARVIDCDGQKQVNAMIHRPWGILDGIRSQACRAINQVTPLPSKGSPKPGRGIEIVGLRPHEEPIGERIHISALMLLKAPMTVPWEKIGGTHAYRPPNLIAALPLIAATYHAWNATAWAAWMPYANRLLSGISSPRRLEVVDWDGYPVPVTPGGSPRLGFDVFLYLGANPSAFGFPPATAAPAPPAPGRGS